MPHEVLYHLSHLKHKAITRTKNSIRIHTYTAYEPQAVQAPLAGGKLHCIIDNECIFELMCLFFSFKSLSLLNLYTKEEKKNQTFW